MAKPLSKSKRIKRVSVILTAIVLSYVIASLAGSAVVFNVIFARDSTVHAFELTYDDVDSERYPRREVRFTSDGNSLFGCVYEPKGGSAGLVMVLNGMRSCHDRHLPEILYFLDSGFSVFTFDNTGVGSSEGDSSVGMAQARRDALAAVDYISRDESLSGLPLVAYGHSLGGYAAATALNSAQEIRAAVCVSGFSSPNESMLCFARRYAGVLADAGYPFMCLQNYLRFGDEGNISAVSAINESQKPVMIIGGSSDDIIPESTSLLGKEKEITNPNAVFRLIDDDYRGEHSTAWLCEDSARYLAETDDPSDKRRANVLDRDFMESLVSFYRKAIAA